MRLSRRLSLATVLLLLAVANVAWTGDWPGWRGPTGQGLCDEKNLPLTWDAKTGQNIVWKTLLHGGTKRNQEMASPGWSCPIVWGERVLVTSAIFPEGLSREERKETQAEHHIVCYRSADGALLWDTAIAPGPCTVDNFYHGYAVPTPVTDGKHVFALFGSAVVAAVDLDGKLAWRRELPVKRKVDGGICSSPVLFQDSLIVPGIGEPGLIALDKATGDVKWRQTTKESNRMATPLLIETGGRRQLVHLAGGFQSLDPETGKLLWSCRAPVGAASPVFGGGLLYADQGRGGTKGTAVEPTGQGDISKTNIRWQTDVRAPAGSSGLVVGDYLYRACDGDTLRCWKMADGELVYEERLPRVSPSTSPIATADGRIYFASSGTSYVIKAGPRFELLAKNELGERDPYATPAVSGGRIFIKGKNYLWCIGSK